MSYKTTTEQKIEQLEQLIIGSLLVKPMKITAVKAVLTDDDFINSVNRIAFQSILELQAMGEYIDCINVEAKSNYGVTFAHLAELVRNVTAPENVVNYAKSLLKYNKRKLVQNVLTKYAFAVQTEESLNEVIESITAECRKILNENIEDYGLEIADGVTQLVEELEAILDGTGPKKILTGFKQLDHILGGIYPGNLVVLAARPSVGKSTFALNIIKNVGIKERKPVLLFSLEMSNAEIIRSVISSLGQIPLHKLKDENIDFDEIGSKFAAAVAMINNAKVIINTDTYSLNGIKKACRRFKMEHTEIGLIVIDYLQLIKMPKAENREVAISDITRDLKILANELNVPILLLSQLNRESEKRPDKTPCMSDLRGSGSIEQDANIVMLMHRAEEHTKIMVEKNRSGPIGIANLQFYGQYATFKGNDYEQVESSF